MQILEKKGKRVLTFILFWGAHKKLIENVKGSLITSLSDNSGLFQQVGLWKVIFVSVQKVGR